MRPTLPIFLAATAAAVAPAELCASDSGEASRAREAALANVVFRIERSGWGKARHADLSAVLKSSCSELAVHFDAAQLKKLEPIRIRRGGSGPITHYQRTLRGEIVVLLSSRDTYWCQHAYQMAHEFGHILCRFRKGDRSNLWFEESLCELASIFAIRRMATSWQTAPPYPNWKNYSKALKDYADDLIEKYTLPEQISLKAWYQAHAAALSADATDRNLNGKVAVRLLPWFEKDPQHWGAVFYLNVGRGIEKQTFKGYLGAWYEHSPAEHKPFVARLGREFGIIP